MSDLYRLIAAALCVWRLTHLLQAEDGPWDISLRIRLAAGEGFFGGLLDCFYCLSLWIALPVALAIDLDIKHVALLWPAISGGAILLERATAGAGPRTPPAEIKQDD